MKTATPHKALSLLLVLAMAITVLPLAAFAAGTHTVTGVTANPTTLTATGGVTTITIEGTDLDSATSGITVGAFTGATATPAVTAVASAGVTATSGTTSLTLQANTTTNDVIYTIKVSFDGGSNWEAETTEVTVEAASTDPGTDPDDLDYEALNSSIETAEAERADVEISADGSDVDTGTYWVTRAVWDALDSAIEAAQAVVDDDDASQDEIDSAVTALDNATNSFKTAKVFGTMTTPGYTALEHAIATAIAERADVEISVDGSDVGEGTYWVTQAVWNTLDTAIKTAQAIVGGSTATQPQITAAVTALDNAITAFKNAKTFGTHNPDDIDEPDLIIYTVSFMANGGAGTHSPVEVIEGDSYTLPANTFTHSGYTFAGWKINNAGDTLPAGRVVTVTGNITLYAQWTANSSSGGSSSGSGSSGGGGGGGGGSSSTVTPPAAAPSANVSSDGSVSQNSAISDLSKAITASGTDSTATVKVQNAKSISASALSALASAAQKAGKVAVVMADTVSANGAVQARLYVEPAKLTGITTEIKLGISTEGAKPAQTKSFFEKHFNNNVSVVSCEQQGSFGASLKIAAKVVLPKDTSKLKFYSYNKATNTFTPIVTTYTIDKNGYIHFMTALAGDIVISDGPLAKK